VYWYQASRAVTAFSRSRQSNVEIGSITSHPPIVLSLETRTSETLGRRLEPLGGYPCRAKSGPSFGLIAVLGHGPLSGRCCRQMMDTPLASGLSVDLYDLRSSRTWLLPGRDDFRIWMSKFSSSVSGESGQACDWLVRYTLLTLNSSRSPQGARRRFKRHLVVSRGARGLSR
jgi:hypothetical protein